MTRVVHTTETVTRHTWHVPTEPQGYAVVGEIRDALGMAGAEYRALTGGSTDHDDWLRVAPADKEILFWFEHREPKQ